MHSSIINPFMWRFFSDGTPGGGDGDTDAQDADQDATDNGGDDNDEQNDEEEGDEDDHDEWDQARALRKIRKLNSENKSLRERKSDAEKSSEDLRKELEELKTEALRLRVQNALGLPDKLMKRVQGKTEEELMQDAEALLEELDYKAEPPSRRPRSPRKAPKLNDTKPVSLDEMGSRIFTD